MKLIGTSILSLVIGFALCWLWLGPQIGHCQAQTVMNQKVIEAATEKLQKQMKELAWKEKRTQYYVAQAQRHLGEQLAQKVGTIDDVWEMPVTWDGGAINTNIRWKSSVNSEPVVEIEHLAAQVEKALKQEATDNHEFIPAAFRGYLGKVMQYGMTRGK